MESNIGEMTHGKGGIYPYDAPTLDSKQIQKIAEQSKIELKKIEDAIKEKHAALAKYRRQLNLVENAPIKKPNALGWDAQEYARQYNLHSERVKKASREYNSLISVYENFPKIQPEAAQEELKTITKRTNQADIASKLKGILRLGKTIKTVSVGTELIDKSIEGYREGYALPTIQENLTKKEQELRLIIGYRAANHQRILKERAEGITTIRVEDGKTPIEVEADYDMQINQLNMEIQRLRADRKALLPPRRTIYDAI